jgi:hypothetical protein
MLRTMQTHLAAEVRIFCVRSICAYQKMMSFKNDYSAPRTSRKHAHASSSLVIFKPLFFLRHCFARGKNTTGLQNGAKMQQMSGER